MCLILIGQIAMSYAADPEPDAIVPRPQDGTTNWGHSVDISKETFIAGWTSYVGDNGGVYIFERAGKEWQVLNIFKTPDGGTRDWYGHSVAIDGDFAVVGAYEDGGKKVVAGGPLGEGPGAIFIYKRAGGKGFAEMVKLKAPDVENNDRFGFSVDLHGTTLVVGAPLHEGEKGAVYVYTLDENKWKQQAKLQSNDPPAKDRFGWSLGIDGNIIVVGAPLAMGAARLSGKAYIFVREGDVWTQQATLTPDDADGGDTFGNAVDVSKRTVVIGAVKDENEVKIRNSGSAYFFSRVGDVWTQQAKVTAADPQVGSNFGFSVAIHDNRALVGAPAEDTKNGDNSGSVYAFLRGGGAWVQQAKVIPEKGPDESGGLTGGDNMGSAVAISRQLSGKESFAAIGVQWDEGPNGDDAGSVYIFDTQDEENLNIPLPVDPAGELALITLGDLKRTALLQNFPNPFNPETWIPYALANDAEVNIHIYNVQGKLVRRLDLGLQQTGRYLNRERAAYWDGRDQRGEMVSSGIYFYTFQADTYQKTRRMVIVK